MFNSVKYVKYFQVFAINSAILSIPDITLTWIWFAAMIQYRPYIGCVFVENRQLKNNCGGWFKLENIFWLLVKGVQLANTSIIVIIFIIIIINPIEVLNELNHRCHKSRMLLNTYSNTIQYNSLNTNPIYLHLTMQNVSNEQFRRSSSRKWIRCINGGLLSISS